MSKKAVRGISVSNPVEYRENYLMLAAERAIKCGYNHFQFIGPIHDPVKGNIDGMLLYKKYSRFNANKDETYIDNTRKIINNVSKKLSDAKIRTYVWHHELELPENFGAEYPDALNDYGDIEITHYAVKDFLENKLNDFFTDYPYINGIILTLHETRIPLLKLKNQKLNPNKRVEYVTKILYDTCALCGKELIVRPFASIEKDYIMMMQAYENISHDLTVMDKWTQFDWSLTLPDNAFFKQIKYNPLLVETDIFGEFFGKGQLPLMLADHIKHKFAYCEEFSPLGYVSRVDRSGYDFFGDVNEVNCVIMEALLNGNDPDEAARSFFEEKYAGAGKKVFELMHKTEELQKKILYLNGYYFNEMSSFPSLNHCKNHFYFEIMRDNCHIASEEWFIPVNWQRGKVADLIKEKEEAVTLCLTLLKKAESLAEDMKKEPFYTLKTKFENLCYTAGLWLALTKLLRAYSECCGGDGQEFYTRVQELLNANSKGKAVLKDKFYPLMLRYDRTCDPVEKFAEEITESFKVEDTAIKSLKEENLNDFIECGGGLEGHLLKKEVNFSDTYILNGELCRIPGTNKGKAWSTVNAHGWFEYSISLRPERENVILIEASGSNGSIDFDLTLHNAVYKIREHAEGKKVFSFTLPESKEKTARIRFDRVSVNTPFIYTIKVL